MISERSRPISQKNNNPFFQFGFECWNVRPDPVAEIGLTKPIRQSKARFASRKWHSCFPDEASFPIIGAEFASHPENVGYDEVQAANSTYTRLFKRMFLKNASTS